MAVGNSEKYENSIRNNRINNNKIEKDNNNIENDNLIVIGRIVRYQGNQGHLRVVPLTDNPRRFFNLNKVILETREGNRLLEVEEVREHKGFIVLKLEGIDSLAEAEDVRGNFLSISENELPELPADNYYIYQLKGMKVVTDTGRELGEVRDIRTDTGTDVFIVSGVDKDYQIPAAKEIILNIDQEKNVITVKPISGLLDL